MSIRVEFPSRKKVVVGKGSAGLSTQIGGSPTSVSMLMEAGRKTGNSIVKKDIG